MKEEGDKPKNYFIFFLFINIFWGKKQKRITTSFQQNKKDLSLDFRLKLLVNTTSGNRFGGSQVSVYGRLILLLKYATFALITKTKGKVRNNLIELPAI